MHKLLTLQTLPALHALYLLLHALHTLLALPATCFAYITCFTLPALRTFAL